MQIRHVDDNLFLEVTDDGVGFDTASLWPHGLAVCGFGLFSIQERTEALGGHFSIHSTPGMGTRAELVLPTKKIEAQCL